MNDSDPEQILADEQSAEQRYNTYLRFRASQPRPQVDNNRFTEADHKELNLPDSGLLIGRVRLVSGSALTDGDQFYIGTARGQIDAVPVFSTWAPLFGDAFYLGGRVDHLGDIHGVRTLDHASKGRISIYADEVLTEHAPTPLFDRQDLAIPKPPARVAPIMVPSGADEVPESPRITTRSGAVQIERTPRIAASVTPPKRVSSSEMLSEELELRAEPILLRKLAAPKRGDMSPVLSTLQPDQYRAITRPATESVIFQGHPGTGKTILAVHRLAYLTSPDAGKRGASGLVMLIGPTREYADHVRPAVRGLVEGDDDYVLVLSLPELFQELAGMPFDGSVDTRVEDGTLVSEDILKYLRATFAAVKKEGLLDGADRQSAIRTAYERLRTSPAFPDGDAMDGDWYRYLRALPPFGVVTEHPELRPVMAYFGIRFRRPFDFSDVSHIIVDESQDVHPLEWEILGRLGATQGWTIFGDINQRRSEQTYRSWKAVASALSIDEEGKAPVVVLNRGYRSTGPIMRYANSLLQRKDRKVYSLQGDGPEPRRVRAPQRDKLAPTAVEQATLLQSQYFDGSVAIIAAATHHVAAALRRAGWSTRSDAGHAWTCGEGVLRLYSHDQARGLEFDAVVVVEPADFPTVEGEGRLGSLYTSLTRANKELVIVNHKALPEALPR